MKKMVYLCPVDWRWIKQRPQFLAEELSEYFQVHAIYPFQNNRKGLQKKAATQVELTPCFSIPTFGGKLSFFVGVNRVLARLQVGWKIRCIRPDYIWLTMPWQIDWIPKKLKCPILYDCMDDYAAINLDPNGVERVIQQEQALLNRSAVVFASSENLKKVLGDRYGISGEKITLLRNGYNANWNADPCEEVSHTNNKLKIGYFGTIGRWFDFPLLLDSLEQNPDVEYHLYGPVERGSQVAPHERIVYHGIIEHNQIQQTAQAMDALMMPFANNDIVSSVDPIKLYEYIYLNKNILCVRYREVERFEPFVMFYESKQDFMDHISHLQKTNELKYTHEQSEQFLAQNSWKQRVQMVLETIRCEAKRKI